jgi:hypothetical protein
MSDVDSRHDHPADRLAEITANLDAYIAAAAERLAAPRIAAAEEAGARAVADIRAEYERDMRRAADLKAEFSRQLDAQHRMVAQLRWAARYLPQRIRGIVLTDPWRPDGWSGERPDEQFAADLDAAAAEAGLTPYPGAHFHDTSGATR